MTASRPAPWALPLMIDAVPRPTRWLLAFENGETYFLYEPLSARRRGRR